MGIRVFKMDMLFKRGFLIASESKDKIINKISNHVKQNWVKASIGKYHVYYDKILDKKIYSKNKTQMLLLGYAVDTMNSIIDEDIIIKNLFSSIEKSNEAFFDYLDNLTGRFIIFYNSPGKSFLLQDAAGTRGGYYNSLDDELLISSHIQLIAEIKEYNKSNDLKGIIDSKDYINHCKYLPGIKSYYKNIFTLTPNTMIDIKNRSIKRFFPREILNKEKNTKNIIEELSGLFQRQIDLIAKKYKLAVSLTGGIDSRLTLAATKNNSDKCVYFTYVCNDDEDENNDALFAEDLARDYKLKHKIYKINFNQYTGYLDEFKRNTAYMRADRQGLIARGLYDMYPACSIHVKSSVGEIGRGFYQKNYPPVPFSKVLLPKIMSYLYGVNPNSNYTINSFKEFINITNFKDIYKYKYPCYDMFYWEHRIGCWQALQILDNDIVHDTFIIYNNRHILKKLLSVNINDRLNNKLQIEIIKNLWDEILKYPINPWDRKSKRTALCKLLWKLSK